MSDGPDQQKVASLFSWRRKLREERPAAVGSIRDACRRLADANMHPADIARYYAQMLNGAAVPTDFAPGQYGRITVA